MSRVAKSVVKVPRGVSVNISESGLVVKGEKGTLTMSIDPKVGLSVTEDCLKVYPLEDCDVSWMRAGTFRSLLSNTVKGVSEGFVRSLELVGVGYKVQVKGSTLVLSLGYSHPIEFKIPDGIIVTSRSQTDISISGIDKQMVGQVASDIRRFRRPEPYKGKGVKYSGEVIVRKEAKKK
ncbi:50S ribosomal subunit protein L6 [Gammaproteobacteria bacterium]